MPANPVTRAVFKILARLYVISPWCIARLVDANVSQPESRLGLAVDDEWRRRGELK